MGEVPLQVPTVQGYLAHLGSYGGPKGGGGFLLARYPCTQDFGVPWVLAGERLLLTLSRPPCTCFAPKKATAHQKLCLTLMCAEAGPALRSEHPMGYRGTSLVVNSPPALGAP